MIRAMKVRKKRAGQKVGLKRADQKLPVLSQAPGVSMKATMPLIAKSDSQAKAK